MLLLFVADGTINQFQSRFTFIRWLAIFVQGILKSNKMGFEIIEFNFHEVQSKSLTDQGNIDALALQFLVAQYHGGVLQFAILLPKLLHHFIDEHVQSCFTVNFEIHDHKIIAIQSPIAVTEVLLVLVSEMIGIIEGHGIAFKTSVLRHPNSYFGIDVSRIQLQGFTIRQVILHAVDLQYKTGFWN